MILIFILKTLTSKEIQGNSERIMKEKMHYHMLKPIKLQNLSWVDKSFKQNWKFRIGLKWNLVYDKCGILFQWEKGWLFNTLFWDTWVAYLDSYLHLYQKIHVCTHVHTHVCIYQIDQIFKYKFCAEVLHEIIGDFFCIIFEDLQVGQR